MGIRNLKKMFSPQSIVVVGASNKEHTIGFVLIRNLIQGGFNGPIMPVSKTDKAIAGILTYESIKNLPLLPDLAIICEDSDNVTEYIRQLGEEKIKAVMLIGTGESSLPDQDEYIKIAKQYDMRLLGPNSMGAIIPRLNLNASCLHVPMKHGKIAFVSQSPSLSSTVLDWTAAHGVGFSHFITMGQCHSIGLGDIIDYLGSDPFTRAILIQMESLTERRNFMSAARAAARNKPLLVLKNNQIFDYNTLTEHENMQNTIDELVYDAAFRRAGMLRVKTIAEMFAGAETLSASKPFKGNRVAIVSNGHGLNMLVTDHMDEFKGKIVTLSDETISRLKTLLKRDEIKLRNPVDMGLTCSAEKYADVYEILQKSKEVDVIFFLHSPSYVENTLECAQKLIEKHKELKGNILTCWLGEGSAYGARHLFEENNIATFQTGRMAVMAFSHMIEYLDNQKALTQTPMRVPNEIKPARTKVRKIIEKALDDSKKWLTDDETKEILKAYGIDVLPSHFVSNETEAIKVADDIGYPIVLKIVTEDDIRKSDIGGVVLSLLSPESIRVAISSMKERAYKFKSDIKIKGFILQKMFSHNYQHELFVGMKHDKVFGPIIKFGQGGRATDVIGDVAIALPPLNMSLAEDVIERTRINKLLQGFKGQAAIDRYKLCQFLVEISEICIDFPEIQELDINPIFCSEQGAVAADCVMSIKRITEKFPNRRLAIRAYPADLEEEFELRNGRKTLIRPIKPEDEPAHNEFVSKVSKEDIRFRFFGSVRELPHSEMARMTQIDYDREMAFIAVAPSLEDGHIETLGVVRTGTDPNNDEAEYAILVRSDLKGQRLGWKLLNKMIDYCRSRGTRYFTGQILRENKTMIDMVKAMGFETRRSEEDDIVEVRLKL